MAKGSAGTIDEQKVCTSDRTEFVKVTRKPSTSTTINKQKLVVTIGKGQVNNEFRTKMVRQRPRTSIAEHPFPKSNFNSQNHHQNNWNQNMSRNYQGPNYMPWNTYPTFPYMNHDNVRFNPNGPMRYWRPNA